MYKKITLVITCCFILLIVALAFESHRSKKEIKNLKEQLEYYKSIDTVLQPKVDSIEYNIIVKDSLVTEIKKKYIDEIEIVKHNNDVDALAEFQRLVGAD